MNPQRKTLLLYIILFLGVIGLLTSVYLTFDHYSLKASACDFSAQVSCSLVNTSIFSEILNVPVAIFGGIWFLVLILLAWRSLQKDGVLASLLVGWNLLGIVFVVYLIIAEIILQALCPFCTVVHVLVIITFILSLSLYKVQKSPLPLQKVLKHAKSWIAVIIILNLLPLIVLNFPGGEKQNYDSVAKCLTEKGMTMYGSFRCGVCAKTRAMFGDSFIYIKEIECHPQGENPQTELCLAKGIEGTPTWILEPNGIEQKRQQGFMSIEQLQQFSGCTQ
ncbi:MAG: vitamin K epoxide reductase family protein [Nanoarchaeota archaeon]|nr:vitamin K epoxide reductase family protein [Nanoarchaeota archaeon]